MKKSWILALGCLFVVGSLLTCRMYLLDNPLDPQSDNYIGVESVDHDGDGIGQWEDVDEISLLGPETGATIDTATVTVTVYEFNPEKITTYWIQVATSNSNFEGTIVWEKNDFSTNECSIPPGSLPSNNTLYYWRAKAFDGSRWSDNWSEVRYFTWAVLIGVPQSPTPGNGTTIGDTTPLLDWADVGNVSGYHLQLNTVNTFFSSLIENSSIVSSQYHVSEDLADLSSYYWRVRAKNAEGIWGDWSEVWSFLIDTTLADAPTALSAGVVSQTRVDLSWTDNANNEDGFKIERNVSGVGYVQIATVGPNISSYSDISAYSNTAISYRVRAYNSNGDSPYSNEPSVVTPPYIVIVDRFNHRLVQINDMSGTGWTTLGGVQGSGIGQFNGPSDIAKDSTGRFYITDRWNHRVVRIDGISGANWTTFGTMGSGVNQFTYPIGVHLDDADRIYIGDNWNSRIVRMDSLSGTGWITYGTYGTGVGNFQYTNGVVTDASGRIYASDSWGDRIVRIDSMTGTNWTSFGSTGVGVNQFIGPHGINLGPDGKIYITDYGHQTDSNDADYRVIRIDNMAGDGWFAFGSKGSGVNQINHPAKVVFDASGKIYIADQSNHRIIRVDDLSGNGWVTFGVNGSGVGQMNGPVSILLY